MQTITEQLNAHYAEGLFAVVCTRRITMPVRDRNMIRASKCGKGVEVQNGKKWVFAFSYDVKFARNAA